MLIILSVFPQDTAAEVSENRAVPASPMENNEETLLFSAELGCQTGLNDGSIPDRLRQEFNNNGISLSKNATVSIQEMGGEWRIDDEGSKRVYTVRRENDELKIYEETKLQAKHKPEVPVAQIETPSEEPGDSGAATESELEGGKEAEQLETERLPSLRKFGYDFFTSSRNRILRLEKTYVEAQDGTVPVPLKARDAISGFVGPIDMMGANVAATVPAKYVLGPGDRLTIHFWSEATELQTVSVVVDNAGEILLPKTGKMIVRGMTLMQFEAAARESIARVTFTGLKLIATLDRLRSIQISIVGEAFRPGSYAVSAVTTMFNALYMCGGPNDNGTLRNIKLLRGNDTQTVDFYKYLMDGDASQDLSLDAGDTVFIPHAPRMVAISGEVRRPAIYELSEGENLPKLTSLAGGIRPSGFLQRVQIDSVDPGKERILRDVDLSDTKPGRADVPIFDGDTVTVFSIPSEHMNTVTLEGEVQMPGIYQLKAGMKTSDLLQAARGLLREAYMERADLFRLNFNGKTTRLIPINLSKALAGDSDNDIGLNQWDRLVVYSQWDVRWVSDRIVAVRGAVQRPGDYERSDGMTVDDLLIQAGGELPDAYPVAALLRLNERREMAESIPIDLRDSEGAIKLKDGDTLLIHTYGGARWEPKREVTVDGAVQNPNTFPRVNGMKISDLIQRAGGPLPDAYPDRGLLLRLDRRQRKTQGFFISPNLALRDDPKNNLELKDGDILKIYTHQEAMWEPKREVTVAGAVTNPNTFERVDGMRVSDLVQRAGGLLPNAFLERADIKRFLADHETYITIIVDLAKVLSGLEAADVLLQDEDLLTIQTLKEAAYRSENVVEIYDMVQRPGTYTRTEGMRISDLLFAAGGLLPGSHREIGVTRVSDDGEISISVVDLTALTGGDESQDILLEDEDVITIVRRSNFPDMVSKVTLLGEVERTGTYTLKHGDRLSDVIQRAGGLTSIAYPKAAIVQKKIKNKVLEIQSADVQRILEYTEDIKRNEYYREVARARLKEKRHEMLGDSAGTMLPAIDTGIPILGSVDGAAEATAMTDIPEQTQASVPSLAETTVLQHTLVTPARKIAFSPSDRLVLDLEEAIARPNSEHDVVLEDGDIITVPAVPDYVVVSGAVMNPLTYVYVKGMKVRDYVRLAGGYSADADKDSIHIVRADGTALAAEEKSTVLPGDIMVIPAKVMVAAVSDRWTQAFSVLKYTVTTLATAYTIKLLVDALK